MVASYIKVRRSSPNATLKSDVPGSLNCLQVAR